MATVLIFLILVIRIVQNFFNKKTSSLSPTTLYGHQYAEIGNGNMNWDLILDTAKKTGIEYYVVEQDGGYAVNCFQSIKTSADFLQRYME